MRLIFLGSGEFGLPTLQALRQRHDVVLVVTQPDRPAGRHRRLTPTPIALYAAEQQIPTLKPHRVNAESLDAITAANADANIVVAFGQFVGQPIIDSPRLGPVATMNLHASLLPRYRGAAPINWAMLSGETETGNTVFSLVKQMDAGPILAIQRTPIDPLETAGELHDRLAVMGADLVIDVLARLQAGSLQPQPQDDAQATPAPKLSRADAVLDFNQPARLVRCRIHALTPWPGVTVWWSPPNATHRHPLLLRRVRDLPSATPRAQPGLMIQHGVIAVGDGQALQLLEVQPPGKKVMSWDDFARGQAVGVGAMLHPHDA